MRLISIVILTLILGAACSSDGSGESILEALGLSENVNVEAPADELSGDDPVDSIAAQLESTGFNGVLLVEQQGELRTLGFGTIDGDASPSVDHDTVFDIGSITKQFTGAAIVRLEMDGALSVNDPVGRHLPEVDGPLADVTLHQLLTHTGGLPDGIGDDEEQIGRADFIARAVQHVGSPGEHRYSNVGYSLLGMVVETASGRSYEQYLRDAFFDPLGMTATGYVLPDWNRHQVAVGYAGTQRVAAPHELNWGDDGPGWNLRANGGLLSSSTDMRRWVQGLTGDAVLSADAKEKLFGRHELESDGGDTYYGYGWVSFPYGDDQWFRGHNGGNGIFFADLLWFPDDDAMIFVATNTSGADEDVAFRLAGLLLDTDVGADCRPFVDLASLPSTATFPATPAGATGAAMVEVLLTDDEAARRAFVDRHVSESLAQDLSPDEQVAALAQLHTEFVGYTVHMIHEQDSSIFHVVLRQDLAEVVLTVETDPDAPDHVTCVHVEFP